MATSVIDEKQPRAMCSSLRIPFLIVSVLLVTTNKNLILLEMIVCVVLFYTIAMIIGLRNIVMS